MFDLNLNNQIGCICNFDFIGEVQYKNKSMFIKCVKKRDFIPQMY